MTPSSGSGLRRWFFLFAGLGAVTTVGTLVLLLRDSVPAQPPPAVARTAPVVPPERIAQARASLARGILREAERQMTAGDYAKAADLFRRSRRVAPEPLAPWIGEIKALRALHRDADARAVAEKLRQERPEAARDAEAGPLLRELASP